MKHCVEKNFLYAKCEQVKQLPTPGITKYHVILYTISYMSHKIIFFPLQDYILKRMLSVVMFEKFSRLTAS